MRSSKTDEIEIRFHKSIIPFRIVLVSLNLNAPF